MKNRTTIILALVLAALTLQTCSQKEDLIMVVEFASHGEATQAMINDPTTGLISRDTEKLTDKGKLDKYAFGQFLRKRYIDER